jgi:hypothetical protein
MLMRRQGETAVEATRGDKVDQECTSQGLLIKKKTAIAANFFY